MQKVKQWLPGDDCGGNGEILNVSQWEQFQFDKMKKVLCIDSDNGKTTM